MSEELNKEMENEVEEEAVVENAVAEAPAEAAVEAAAIEAAAETVAAETPVEAVAAEAPVEAVAAEAPVETMEDYAAELEASYQTLNKRRIQMTEEESGQGAKWAQFEQMMEDRTVVKVKITEAVKGGVVTSLEDVRAFIPASQLSTEYVEKLEDWQGKYIEAILITVDPEKKRIVLSGREVEKEKKAAERKERMEQFKAGAVAEGTVDSIKPYGAFVKLADGVDGLLHISQISTQRIKHPSAVLTEGQKVTVKILSTENGKLSLSMKVLAEQQADRDEHETFDYKETGSVSTGLGDLLKGLKL